MQLLLRWRVLLTVKPDLGHTPMALWFQCMALQAECKSCWGSNPSCWVAASVSHGQILPANQAICRWDLGKKDLCQACLSVVCCCILACMCWPGYILGMGVQICWFPSSLWGKWIVSSFGWLWPWCWHWGEQACGTPVSTAEEALLLPPGLYLSSRIALLSLFLPMTSFKLFWCQFQVGGEVAKEPALI